MAAPTSGSPPGGQSGQSLGPATAITKDSALAALDSLLANGPDTDLELVCAGGEVVRAHSTLLRLVSPIMSDMLSVSEAQSSWEAAGTNGKEGASVQVLQVPDDAADVWRIVLLFVYPVYPHPAISLAHAHPLLPLAHKYAMAGLLDEVQRCVQGSASQLHPTPTPAHTSIVAWAGLGERLHLEDLVDVCTECVQQLQPSSKVELFLSTDWEQAGAPLLCTHIVTTLTDMLVPCWLEDLLDTCSPGVLLRVLAATEEIWLLQSWLQNQTDQLYFMWEEGVKKDARIAELEAEDEWPA